MTGIPRSQWRVIILSSLGGALEFYDFVIYSMFAKYIGAAFFPASDSLTSLMLSFTVFAVGYVARPLGGIVFSHFGDKYGRRPVFIIAILTMSLATVGIGVLPTYAQWGLAAPILMVILRLLQGFSLGGELPGAITYVVETAPKRASFAAGFIFFCVNSGVALASLLSLVVHEVLAPDEVAAWGWRIGFLFGGLAGLVSFWLRLSLEETQEFKTMKSVAAKKPLVELLKTHPANVAIGIAALTATAGFNGLLFAMPAFLPEVMHYSSIEAIKAQNVGLLVLSFGMLVTAWLGDRFPRRFLLGAGALILVLLAVPFFNAAASHSMNLILLFALAGVGASLVNGTMAGVVADLFPTRIRFSGVAVSFNLAFSIFSGPAALAAAALVRIIDSPTGPAWYMCACAAITFIGSLFLHRHDGRILADRPAAQPLVRASTALAVVAAGIIAIAAPERAYSADSIASPAAKPIKPAPAFTKQQLTEIPKDAWITNGGNVYNQRYSPLTEINLDTVKNLKAEWRIHLNSGLGPQYSGQAQPLFYDGVLYHTTGANDVFAIDVETGSTVWKYEAKLDPARVKVCCGWVARGVGLGDGKVYVGQLDAKLVALDQRSGKVVWSIQAEDPLVGYSIVSAPLYYDGMVITGFGGGDMGVRGRVKAYDAKNGKLLWTFYTVPGPGEIGSETWPKNNDYYKYGGAAVWQTPAVDPDLGLLYFSTGNAGPDYNGADREGDNLFTVSMVAIEAKTGKYRWHFQQVRHDIWDYDSPNPVVLFDAPYDGKMRKGIAQISKTAWVYILDRETGKPLTPIEDRPVLQEPRQKTAATQPYVLGDPLIPQFVDIAPEGFELVNGGKIFTPFWDKPIVYKPQMAVNWPPSSYDPETNYFFVCGIDNLAISVADPSPFKEPAFRGMWLATGAMPFVDAPRRGVFGAYDLKTNRLVWNQAWSQGCMSGSINTAGGLIFVGRSDGRFTALDKRNGKKVWEFLTDAGVNATASTFLHKGRQYIAVMSAGTLFGGSKKGDSVWLFSLAGKIESIPINTQPPRIPGAPAAGPANLPMPDGDPNVGAGKELYSRFCVACHGDTGLGGHGGGASLAGISTDMRAIYDTASNGKNTNMPPFKGALKPEELRDIAGYISKELIPAHRR